MSDTKTNYWLCSWILSCEFGLRKVAMLPPCHHLWKLSQRTWNGRFYGLFPKISEGKCFQGHCFDILVQYGSSMARFHQNNYRQIHGRFQGNCIDPYYHSVPPIQHHHKPSRALKKIQTCGEKISWPEKPY